MADGNRHRLSFDAHVELLHCLLASRKQAVEAIEDLLNARRKPIQYLQDRALLSRLFEDCFYRLPAVGQERLALRGQLEEAHWASGFRPRQVSSLHNDLIHPAEMMIRGFFCWHQTRWPGRNARIRYAETLFNVYLVRNLELLSMRLWDAGPDAAGERLAGIQAILDALWQGSPEDQPVLLRDARWLIPLAQSPTTDALAPYFEVAEHVAGSLTAEDRIEVQKAAVVMIGGHLRSQIRHYCLQEDLSIDDESVIRRTRTSNALDFALLIQGMAALLEAYEQAVQSGDTERRLELANAILQGVSPDPQVFLNRLDLLGAYSMIEHLFVETDTTGKADYSSMGRRHLRLLWRYTSRIGRVMPALREDSLRFRPAANAYSPYGAIFGTPSNLTEHMALKAIQRDAETRFALEDVFTDGGSDKLAWVNGWRRLPHIDPALQKLHDYPQSFAKALFDRIETALGDGAAGTDAPAKLRPGRLFVGAEAESGAAADAPRSDALPARFLLSSDDRIVADGSAVACDEAQLLRDRFEGHFALSYETADGWVGIRKDFLTDILGAGQDVRVDGLPAPAASVLRLMCPGLIATAGPDDQASAPPSMAND